MSERRLRIGQVAPVGAPVCPGIGESVESLISTLCEKLTDRGHEVTLFATGDSRTSARLVSLYAHSYLDDDDVWDWTLAEAMHAAHAFRRAGEFDVVHCHTHYGLASAALSRTPVVHTQHLEMGPELLVALNRLDHIHVITPSQYQNRALGGRPKTTVVPHGIDVDAFPFRPERGAYLLFLGRMIADKGPLQAVEVARAVGMPLILAGPREDGFSEQIAPHLDAPDVTYVGRVDSHERDLLLSEAAALLYPLQYPEPFGLVVVEAMACGTPVIATAVGAVPELVDPGVTGLLAPSAPELVSLVPAALALDRGRVRARARERFDVRAMVDRYEAIYRQVAGG